MKAKVLLVAEIEIGDSANPHNAVDRLLDKFRESVRPGLEYDLTLYQAMSDDLVAFLSAGKLLPIPEPLVEQE